MEINMLTSFELMALNANPELRDSKKVEMFFDRILDEFNDVSGNVLINLLDDKEFPTIFLEKFIRKIVFPNIERNVDLMIILFDYFYTFRNSFQKVIKNRCNFSKSILFQNIFGENKVDSKSLTNLIEVFINTAEFDYTLILNNVVKHTGYKGHIPKFEYIETAW